MNSAAQSVKEYLDLLPESRREIITQLRNSILRNLPAGYEENMNWGMISYEVPLSYKPDTYNKKPLLYAAIASQKNHVAVYVCSVYANPDRYKKFVESFRRSGKKLNIGKACVRIKHLDDLPQNILAETIAAVPMARFVEEHEAARAKAHTKS